MASAPLLESTAATAWRRLVGSAEVAAAPISSLFASESDTERARFLLRLVSFDAPLCFDNELLVQLQPTGTATQAASNDGSGPATRKRVNHNPARRADSLDEERRQALGHSCGVRHAVVLVVGLRHAYHIARVGAAM